MKANDVIKKQTVVIAVAVVLVAVALMGVSYAIFFDVASANNTQSITAGSLKLDIDYQSASYTGLVLSEPVSDATGSTSEPIHYTITNMGSLTSAYDLCVYVGDDNEVALDAVKIKVGSGDIKTLGTNDTPEISVNGKTCYKIDHDEILANDARNNAISKDVRVWLDETEIEEENEGETIDLQLNIVGVVKE